MESSSWDGVAASLRRTNAHVESTFGAVVRENASLNAQRYAQDAAMAEMRCELARLRSEAADVLGRREVMEEAGRLEKRVAGLQRELSASNAAERALQEERVALADALHGRERALERAAAALDASRASEAALGALRAEGAADVRTLRRELELRTAAEARCREESGLLRAQNDDLVTRLVADKQRLVGEMNGMNDIIDRLKRELELRAEEAPPAPTCVETNGLGGPDQTSEFSSSVKSESIRLIFGRLFPPGRDLEVRITFVCTSIRIR